VKLHEKKESTKKRYSECSNDKSVSLISYYFGIALGCLFARRLGMDLDFGRLIVAIFDFSN